jgi:hypothetical protein
MPQSGAKFRYLFNGKVNSQFLWKLSIPEFSLHGVYNLLFSLAGL